MPKQTFLSQDFFINSSEDFVKEKILNLPKFFSHITFVKENTIVQSIKFLYHTAGSIKEYHIDVSILSLNKNQSKITLHCSYTNGSVFQKDPYIKNALQNFEAATKACLNNTISDYEVCNIKRKPLQKIYNYFASMVASIG